MMNPHIKVFSSAVYSVQCTQCMYILLIFHTCIVVSSIWSLIYTHTTIGLVSQQNRKEVSNPQDTHCLDFDDCKCETSR